MDSSHGSAHFTGWIYDHLTPHAAAVKVAHPLMLRAIAAARKKNDSIDAGKIADCLRCDFLPECYMPSTPDFRPVRGFGREVGTAHSSKTFISSATEPLL